MTEPSSPQDFARVSFTAEKILQKRAYYTSIPRAREMAEALGVHWQVSRWRALLRRIAWGEVRAGRYIQFRYDALSDALAEHEGWGVVEVAAGYSTRGLVEAARRELYVESDLPDLIRHKPALVAAIAGEPRPNHCFAAVDICSRSDTEHLRDLLLARRLVRPLAVVNEGLLPYLDRDEKRRARDDVRWLLEQVSPGGVWITTDLSERDETLPLLQRVLTRRLVRRVQRELQRFADDGEAHAFLREGGLIGEKLPNLRAGDEDAEVRASAENLRAWRIRLA